MFFLVNFYSLRHWYLYFWVSHFPGVDALVYFHLILAQYGKSGTLPRTPVEIEIILSLIP